MTIFAGLIALWLVAYKSADVFNFFETYSSLWFLPAGVTLSIVMVAPVRYVLAPLVANLLLAIPVICSVLGIAFTGYRDPILHSLRLFAVYGGAGLLLRFGLGSSSRSNELQHQIRILIVTMLAAIIGALTGVSLHAMVGNFPWSVAWDILIPWAVGDAIGAFIVPPLLVPLLKRLAEPNIKQTAFPDFSVMAFQILMILLAMFIAFWGAQQATSLGSLWYVILIPPVFFAVRGGFPSAATATALTTLLTPPTAYLLGFDGDRVSLQFLLLVSVGISLMIGAAITDRLLAFEAVKRSEENLEQQVHDRTAELREAYEFQQHLIRSIGHDLRQPVQSINMMMQGLVREYKGTASAARLEQARDISEAAGGFITRVVGYAKRDAGKAELLAERFPVQRVFDQIQHTFSPHADASRDEVNQVLAPLASRADVEGSDELQIPGRCHAGCPDGEGFSKMATKVNYEIVSE